MVELTTNNLIKIGIAVAVIVIVITGVYLSFNSYIVPYFTGISFNQTFGGNVGICEGQGVIGRLDEKNFFVYEKEGLNEDTNIYFLKKKKGSDEIWVLEKSSFLGITPKWDRLNPDEKIGRIDVSGDIEVFMSDAKIMKIIQKNNLERYANELNGAILGGKQICKP